MKDSLLEKFEESRLQQAAVEQTFGGKEVTWCIDVGDDGVTNGQDDQDNTWSDCIDDAIH